VALMTSTKGKDKVLVYCSSETKAVLNEIVKKYELKSYDAAIRLLIRQNPEWMFALVDGLS